MQRTKKGLHLKRKNKSKQKLCQSLDKSNISPLLSGSPLHLLHQLQQGLLELVADGGSCVFPGDCAALPHVTSSLLTSDLCVNQEEV